MSVGHMKISTPVDVKSEEFDSEKNNDLLKDSKTSSRQNAIHEATPPFKGENSGGTLFEDDETEAFVEEDETEAFVEEDETEALVERDETEVLVKDGTTPVKDISGGPDTASKDGNATQVEGVRAYEDVKSEKLDSKKTLKDSKTLSHQNVVDKAMPPFKDIPSTASMDGNATQVEGVRAYEDVKSEKLDSKKTLKDSKTLSHQNVVDKAFKGILFLISLMLSLLVPFTSNGFTDAQRITGSTLIDQFYACPNSSVSFTCETRDSHSIAWKSKEYIGDGDSFQLIFTSTEHEGLNKTHGSSSATLDRNEEENGQKVLESTLTVSVKSSASNVTCVNYGSNNMTTRGFNILSLPDKPIILSANMTMDKSGNCFVHIKWRPSGSGQCDEANYMVYVDETNVNNATDCQKTHSVPIGCNIQNVSVSAVDRCDRVSERSTWVLEQRNQAVSSSPYIGLPSLMIAVGVVVFAT